MKKIVAALAAVILVLAPVAGAKERPGARAVLALKDGRSARGELYAVKSREIEIVNALGGHETYEVETIRRIELRTSIRKIVKTGALIGFGTGAVIGIKAVAGDDHGTVGLIGYAGLGALLGLALAVPGAWAGWMIGESVRSKTFALEGLSDQAMQEKLSKIRKHARVGSLT